MSLTDIGKLFSVSLSLLTRSRDRVKQRIETKDKDTLVIIEKIKKSIAEV